jgi:hypothetical protein
MALWSGSDVRITQDGETIVQITNVVRVEEDLLSRPETAQDSVLLRLWQKPDVVRALFIDDDQHQTSVREVDPSLVDVNAVIEWLLPAGYMCRQGDIGIYRRDRLPPNVREVRVPADTERLKRIVGRHVLDRQDACKVFISGTRPFVLVQELVRLIHPEHSAIELDKGLYELVASRGRVLPPGT